jgi:hypothetical protein
VLEVHLDYDSRLDGLDQAIVAAVHRKMTELATLMHEKVIENLSGKILQKQTGQLLSSVHQRVDLNGDVMSASVFVEPESPKAWALEKGGERYYAILPVKARVLAWIDKGGEKVFRPSVHHPPSRAFRYLGEAFDEVRPMAPEMFQEVIQDVLDGKI